ncbi:MAG: septum formation inhibitor Maf [Parcubacteria group bacterium]|nr:septum formation inhibitor Maf [Parcubacteria group bacterium]
MMQKRKIILASKSPRRKKLLEQIGLEFEICQSNFDEDSVILADPIELAKFLALKKAEAVAKNYDDAIIIGADTFTILENKFIGKPKDKDEARIILKNFSGREHKVITGLAIIDTASGQVIKETGQAVIKFRNLDEREIEDYIATGEPLDAAGAYNMNDHGAALVESISGDYYTVVGLPLSKLYVELRKLGAI